MYKAKLNVWDIEHSDNYERVCNYLKTIKNKIINVKTCYKTIKEVFGKFSEATKIYMESIRKIAMELQPNDLTDEGKLIQAIQGILLFKYESLDSLVNNIQSLFNNLKANKESNSSAIEELSQIYQLSLCSTIQAYCDYVLDNEKYEKYLIHKELNISGKDIYNNNENKNSKSSEEKESENEKNLKSKAKMTKRGSKEVKIDKESTKLETEKKNIFKKLMSKRGSKELKRDTDKDKECEKEEKKEEQKQPLTEAERLKAELALYQKAREDLENKAKGIDKDKNKDKDKDIKGDLYDHSNIFKSKKKYEEFVKVTNEKINKLVDFGYIQEKNIQIDLCNYTKKFLFKLIDCIDSQKKNYLVQSTIFENVDKSIKSEQLERYYLEPQEYSLHSLSIYMNCKGNFNKNLIEHKQKGDFDNDLYKKLTIDNIGNIIKEMQKGGIKLKKEDLKNYEIQKNIAYIENNVKMFFQPEFKLKEEDRKKMIELLNEDKDYIFFFLQKLNNDRARWGNITNSDSYDFIGKSFKMITDKILENNDFLSFKYISILSMTYYREEGNKKIYIYEYIKDHPYFKQLNFWEKYLEILIDNDLNSSVIINKKLNDNHKDDNNEEEKKSKTNFACYSNLLTVFNNMTDFDLEKNFVQNFINNAKKKYEFTPAQLQQINGLWSVYEEKLQMQDSNYDKKTINNKEG